MGQELPQLHRQRCTDADAFISAGVLKGDARSMQEKSAEQGQRLPTDAYLPRRAIQGIADHRAAERSKMDANLMRAPGVRDGFHQRERRKAAAHAPVGARRPTFLAASGHADAAAQIAGHWQFDAAR